MWRVASICWRSWLSIICKLLSHLMNIISFLSLLKLFPPSIYSILIDRLSHAFHSPLLPSNFLWVLAFPRLHSSIYFLEISTSFFPMLKNVSFLLRYSIKLNRWSRVRWRVFATFLFRTTFLFIQISSSYVRSLSRFHCHIVGQILRKCSVVLSLSLTKSFCFSILLVFLIFQLVTC